MNNTKKNFSEERANSPVDMHSNTYIIDVDILI